MKSLVFNNVQLTLSEYLKANLILSLKATPVSFFIRCFSPIIATGYFSQFGLPQLDAGIPYAPVLLIFFLLMLGAVGFGWYTALKRGYLSLPIPREPATLLLDDTIIQVSSLSTQARITWPDNGTLYIIKPYAILMTSPATGYYLDFRCLEAPATEADLVALAHRHNVPVK